MNKFVTLLLLSFLFVGCNKSALDSLVGAIYVGDIGSGDLRAIEFTSSSECKAYATDENLGERSPSYGTYTKNGNNITFSGLTINYFQPHDVTGGTLSGDFLTITTSYYSQTGKRYIESTYRFQRKK